MSASELRKGAAIAPNTLTKMREEQELSLSVLGKSFDYLQCDFKDIIEYKLNKNMDKAGENICD